MPSLAVIEPFFYKYMELQGLPTIRRDNFFCNHNVVIITDKGLSAFPLKELNSVVKCPLV